MKTLLSTLALAATLVGCGAADQGSTVSTSLHPDTFSASNKLLSVDAIEGTLMSTNIVRKEVAPNVMGSATNLNLRFYIGCLNTVSPLQHEVVKGENGKATVYVSAFEEFSKNSLVAFCMERPYEDRTIQLNGMYQADDLTIVYNQGPSRDITEADVKITATSDVRLGKVSPLCPEGAQCIAGGTQVELVVGTSGCMDDAAVSYTAVPNGKTLDLYVGALNIGSKRSANVRCYRQNTESFTVSLVNQFYNAKNIKVHVLGAK